MKSKKRIALIVALSVVSPLVVASTVFGAWYAVKITQSDALKENLYEVKLYSGNTLYQSFSGLEKDSYFSLPYLADNEGSHETFSGWKQEDGATHYTGSVCLSSFTFNGQTLSLYADYEKQVVFQVTSASDSSVIDAIPVLISSPYEFLLWNLNPTYESSKYAIKNYTYTGTASTLYYQKRTETGYSRTSGRVFLPNDMLILDGESGHFPELASGGSFIIPLTVTYVSLS